MSRKHLTRHDDLECKLYRDLTESVFWSLDIFVFHGVFHKIAPLNLHSACCTLEPTCSRLVNCWWHRYVCCGCLLLRTNYKGQLDETTGQIAGEFSSKTATQLIDSTNEKFAAHPVFVETQTIHNLNNGKCLGTDVAKPKLKVHFKDTQKSLEI